MKFFRLLQSCIDPQPLLAEIAAVEGAFEQNRGRQEKIAVQREALSVQVIFTTPLGFRDQVDFRIDPAQTRIDFRSRSLHPRSLLDGFTMHFRDAGLPLLFLEAFLLMGAFVTLFNYIGYRLLAAPYNLDQVFVGLLSVVYLSGIYSSAKIGSLADKLGRRKVLWATIALMFAGLALTMFTPL